MLETVIVTPVLVPRFPLGSWAAAATVWLPFVSVVVSNDVEYGALVTCGPALAPSTRNCTKETGLSGSVAVAVSVIVPETVAPFAGAVTVTTGGVVSDWTVKLTPLLATPPTVTTTLPVVAPVGTGTTMLVALQLVGVAAIPLNFTVLVPCVAPKFAPVIVTDVPTNPDVGFTLVMLAGEGFPPPPGLELPAPQPTIVMANAKTSIHRTNCLVVSLKIIPLTAQGYYVRA